MISIFPSKLILYISQRTDDCMNSQRIDCPLLFPTIYHFMSRLEAKDLLYSRILAAAP